MFEKILCANDGSERACRALALAIKIAKENNSKLRMVSVEESVPIATRCRYFPFSPSFGARLSLSAADNQNCFCANRM